MKMKTELIKIEGILNSCQRNQISLYCQEMILTGRVLVIKVNSGSITPLFITKSLNVGPSPGRKESEFFQASLE